MAKSTPDNFLGLDAQQAAYATARFAVLPVPYDATTSYGTGTRDGPRAIITASQQVELYDPELGHVVPREGLATLQPLDPDARGPDMMLKRIYSTARRIVQDGKFLITLGGEHSITTPLVRAVRTKYQDLTVLQIDAHADLHAKYHDSPDSHACVMRRIHELGVPAVGVGIRSFSASEARFIRTHKLPIFSAHTCHESPDWIADVLPRLGPNVYVTIDIDGFDPSIAPGTGTPEPGGLDWYQVTNLLAAVARQRRIVATDLVEVRPFPPANVTEFLAARLLHRLIALVSA
ncbi:MAG: agmatinase [Planctomycetota bacterium]